MPQVEDYIPYVYQDADDMARSWDLVIETYKIKLDELKWYKLSIDEQKMKFASFAEIAKNDPERYIKDIALYVESIIHKTVYVIVKKKFHGRSAKEVSNAAMDVINMVALNTRTIAKYNPSFAPSTYMQTYIQSAVTKVVNNNACNSGDERFLKRELKKISLYAQEYGSGWPIPPSIMYAIFEAQMLPNVSYSKIKSAMRMNIEISADQFGDIVDNDESFESIEGNIIVAEALDYIKAAYGERALDDFIYLNNREQTCRNVFADASKDEQAKLSNGMIMKRKLQNDTTLMRILDSEYMIKKAKSGDGLKLTENQITDEQFEAYADGEIIDE